MIYTKTYIESLKKIQSSILDIKKLENISILITGSTGMIGSALVDVLMQRNIDEEANIQIYAASRSEEKFKSRFRIFLARKELHFFEYEAIAPFRCKERFNYIICAAGNADPKTYREEPVETMLGNILGLNNLLKYAVETKVDRVLYISSSEVYGKKKENASYSESEYGYVDILNARACYPSAKRAGETLNVAYIKEYDIDAVIVRPGHIYGPTQTKKDVRAASEFARKAAEGEEIVMKSDGAQLRSYCYVLDCATAILAVLLKGHKGEAYNISNKASLVTVKRMAEAFADAGECKIVYDIPTNEEKKSYNMMENSSLNSKKLEELGWRAIFSMQEGACNTVKILKEAKSPVFECAER